MRLVVSMVIGFLALDTLPAGERDPTNDAWRALRRAALESGQRSRERGVEKSVALFRGAVHADPESTSAWYGLAIAELAAANDDAAEAAIERIRGDETSALGARVVRLVLDQDVQAIPAVIDFLCSRPDRSEAALLTHLVAERVGFNGRSGLVYQVGATQYMGAPLRTVPCAADDDPFTIPENAVFPRASAKTAPVFPKSATAVGAGGDVLVLAFVDTDGEPYPLATTETQHPALPAAALDAVRSWKFSPGLWKGTVSPFLVIVTVRFRR